MVTVAKRSPRRRHRRASAALGALGVALLGLVPAATPAGAAAGPGALPPADAGASAAWLVAARPAGTAPGPAPVVVQGHGAGGGVGLGQWGAYGYAVELHKSWTWIVGHYYTGTYLEPVSAAASSDIGVDLAELDSARRTQVEAAEPGARLRVGGTLRTGVVDVAHHGKEVTVAATRGDVAVDLPGVGWRDYQGSIRVQADGRTWDVLPLEAYVADVVPAESPAGWGSAPGGEAALQAQAVATRSYALAYVAADGAICDTTTCQVDLGDPADQSLGSSLANVTTAVSTTAGQVMCTVAESPCPPADVAMTEFGASSGGWTTSAGPFDGVEDLGDGVAGNPYHDWSAGGSCPTTFPAETVAKDVGLRKLTSIKVTVRSGGGAWGGRALEVAFTGTAAPGRTATVTESGTTVAEMLGLCSTWFRFAGV